MPDLFDKQGHRGCRGLMPENTIPAFKKAIELGVTTLEMDTVITKDKKVLLSHEPFFNHEITTRFSGQLIEEKEEKSFNIYEMTYEQTTKFDVGIKQYPRFPLQQKLKTHKPLLVEVIDFAESYAKHLKKSPVYYNIETKCLPQTDTVFHPGPVEFVDLLMNVIRSKKIEQRVVIQSFDVRTLQYLRFKYPAIKTALLVEPPSNRSIQQQLNELGFVPTIYSPDYSMVDTQLVEYCKKMGMKLIPWTVNTIEEMQQLKDMSVDGVISDYPNLFVSLK
jgi:glycerophosphoryl diester phosphodiesterase